MTVAETDYDPTYYEPHANWSLIPQHMHGAVRRYVMNGIPPESFLTAVLSGASLSEIASRADDENGHALVGWAKFIHNYVPSAAHGSPERVSAWLDRGGVNDRQRAAP